MNKYGKTTVFISASVFDLRMRVAANYVNEMLWNAVCNLCKLAGLKIENIWGTFASQRGYKHLLNDYTPGLLDIFKELSDYYGSNLTACILSHCFQRFRTIVVLLRRQ